MCGKDKNGIVCVPNLKSGSLCLPVVGPSACGREGRKLIGRLDTRMGRCHESCNCQLLLPVAPF